MNQIAKRKLRQHMQKATDQQFWDAMNIIHNQVYHLAQKQMREAMECIPGITKKQIEAVIEKTKQIREQWDGMPVIEVESSIEKLLSNGGTHS